MSWLNARACTQTADTEVCPCDTLRVKRAECLMSPRKFLCYFLSLSQSLTKRKKYSLLSISQSISVPLYGNWSPILIMQRPRKLLRNVVFYWLSSLYSFWVFVGHKSLQAFGKLVPSLVPILQKLKTFMVWHQFSKSWRLLWPEFTSSLIELLTQLSTGFFFFFFLSSKALTLFSSISA